MNFGISGILYGTKRSYNSLYDGRGSRTPSTYSIEVYGNRGNEGGAEMGHGILYGGLDWVYVNGGYEVINEHGDRMRVANSIKGWVRCLLNCTGCGQRHPVSQGYDSLGTAMQEALWIMTGRQAPYLPL